MERKKLLAGLQAAAPVIAQTTKIDGADCFRIKGDTLIASNGSTAIKVQLGLDTGIDGMVPADKFLALVRDLSADDITIKQTDTDLEILAGRSRATYKVRPGGGFLDGLVFEPPGGAATIATKAPTIAPKRRGQATPPVGPSLWQPWPVALGDGIQLCKFAAARDTGKGAMCGVHVTPASVQATDTYRIADFAMTEPTGVANAATLPMEAIDVLAKQGGPPTDWAVVNGTVYIRLPNVIILTQALAGDFPNVGQFLDKAENLKSVVTFPPLVREAIKRHADQLVDVADIDKEVTVNLDGAKMVVSSTDGVIYTLAEDMDLEGVSAIRAAFKINPVFLADILGKTRTMKFDPAAGLLAFESEGFTYLTTVEWQKEKE